MSETKVIGIDLGATNIRAGIVQQGSIKNIQSKRIISEGRVEEVLADFYLLIDALLDKEVVAIGIGVPAFPSKSMAIDLSLNFKRSILVR